MQLGDVVKVKGTKGCCNSTICFWEWEVVGLSTATFNETTVDVAMIKCNNDTEIVPVSKLEVLVSVKAA